MKNSPEEKHDITASTEVTTDADPGLVSVKARLLPSSRATDDAHRNPPSESVRDSGSDDQRTAQRKSDSSNPQVRYRFFFLFLRKSLFRQKI